MPINQRMMCIASEDKNGKFKVPEINTWEKVPRRIGIDLVDYNQEVEDPRMSIEEKARRRVQMESDNDTPEAEVPQGSRLDRSHHAAYARRGCTVVCIRII